MKKIYLLSILCCLSMAAIAQTTVSTGFENAGAFPPTGWTVTGSTSYLAAVSGTGGNPTTSGPHGGTYYGRFNSYSASSGAQAQLITPIIDWSNRGGVATSVTIWWWRDVASYNSSSYDLEGVTAYVNTSASLTGATSLGYVPRRGGLSTSGSVTGTATTTTSGWYQYTFPIPTTFNSGSNYIIFNFYSNFGDNCFIDDVVYTTYPACSAPAITGSKSACVGLTTNLSDATTGGVWSSSNTSVATINASTGVVTGVTTGTSNISYVVSGCVAGTTVTVNPVPVATATATPGTICGGASSTLSVTSTNPGATYSVSSITYALASQTSPTTATFSPNTDDGKTSVSLPFTFTYFGTPYTSISMCTNGYVQLGGSSTSYSATSFPTSLVPGAIALFWGDLDVLSPGAVTYSTEGTAPNRTFVIKYNQVAPCCTYADSYDGEVILYETSNDIDILVSKAASGTHTCGIQDAAYSSFVTPAGRNGASYSITAPEAWRFHFPTPTFAWVADATLSSTTIANPTAGPLSATHTYTAIATAPNGCPATTTVTVTVNPPPSAITGTLNVCQTGTTTLSSSAGGTWTSSNTGVATVASGGTSTGIVSGIAPGTATITYAYGSSCSVTQAVTVLATAPVSGPGQVCPGLTITLSDVLTGGTWTSGNTSLATVAPSTGVVTGVAAGTPSIIYTLPNGCARNATITVNPLPAAFSGSTTVCKGLSSTITETSTGGVWSSSSTSIAVIGSTSSTTATLTGVDAGVAFITYTLPTTCIMSASVLVNPLPVPITAPAAGSCVTDANNPVITLYDGSTGGAWSSSNVAVATIVNFSGDLTSLAPGTTIITYTLPTSCISTTALTVNALPGPIAGNKVVCANAVTYLNDSDIGGSWSTSNPALATVDPGLGIVTGVSGLSNPIITYTSAVGCKAIATLTVNAAPGTVTGSSNVCVGSTTTLAVGGGGTWTSSNPGLATVTAGPVGGGVVKGIFVGNPFITYTLPGTGCFNRTAITVNPVPAAITPAIARVCMGGNITLNDATAGGTWSSSAPGTAAVSGTGMVTTGTSIVSPTAVAINYTLATGWKATNIVTVTPLPVAYNLSTYLGATHYCAGGAGIDVQLNGSTTGVNYQLYNGGPVGTPQPGNGGVLDFGLRTAGGTYTATAVDVNSGCTNNMTGTAVINVDPLPVVYTLTHTGATSNYCDVPGATGIDMCLSGSQAGWIYELFVNGSAGPVATGTGSSVCFGAQTATGTYIAVATDPSTFCTSNMTGSVKVGKDVLPDIHVVTVTNGGNYCAGGPGVHIGLDYANTGVSYDLLYGATVVATRLGANSGLDFGLQTGAGSYTVVATNAITNCQSTMAGSPVVTILPLPGLHSIHVSGTSSYCIGGTGVHLDLNGSDGGIKYTLLHGTMPVVPYVDVPGTGSAIDLGYQTMTGTYSVTAVDAATGCSDMMTGSAAVTTYPALSTFSVTVAGTGHYCAGPTGVHIFLSGSTAGVKYDLVNSAGVVATKTGTGLGLDFGAQTATGTYSVVATSTTGCTANMAGNPAIVIDALPGIYPTVVDNGGNYCSGGTGVHIQVSFSEVGVTYQLYAGGVAVGTAKPGSSSSIDFGAFTTGGSYTITATNNTTGCKADMTRSLVVTVNPQPVAYTMTGGGSYCSGGTGALVGLAKSNYGVNYQLFSNGSVAGAPVPGNGSAISFGLQTATSLYTVVGTDVTTGCTNNMLGSKVITTDPLPVVYNVTGGGDYCAGGTGVHAGLNNSVTGVDYRLYNGGLVTTLHGSTGHALDFGAQTAAGTYTVVGITVVSGCASNMSGSATVIIDPLPGIFTIGGGGNYCAGDAGADVYISGSEPGVYYQLFAGSAAVGGKVAGTGTRLDLGPQTVPGMYTAVAYNAASGCTRNMAGSVVVGANPAPTAYAVSGGGEICAGSPGTPISLVGSQTGVDYQLLDSGAMMGTLVPGTGAALNFGLQTVGGIYTVVGTDKSTGCKSTMKSSGLIVVHPAPTAFAVTGGGNICTGGKGAPVGVANSHPGVNYQLYFNATTAVGLPIGGTGSAINFGLQTNGGSYTVLGTNTGDLCAGNMSGSAAIVEDATVVPVVKIKGTDGISCIGNVVTYVTDPVNGGTPSYTWKVNGAPAGTDSTLTVIPVDGDVISVLMVSNAHCASTPVAASTLVVHTLPYIMPAATVTTDPGAAVCAGTLVTMNATATDGGDAPVYTWLKNSVVVGSGTNYSYTPAATDDGDVIEFRLTSNYRCRMADTVFSTPVVMAVDVAAIPDFTLTAHLGPVIVGQVDTFIATIKNTKNASVTYQWYVEGTLVPGENLPVYINHNVYNDDKVTCAVTRIGACGNQTATKETTVLLKNLATGQVAATVADISVQPNPNKGTFTIKGTLGTGSDKEVSAEITNMLGQVIYTNKVMARNGSINEQIRLSNTLPNGMYLLTLKSDVEANVFHIAVEQ